MEWVRDDVMVAVGMLQAGFVDEARTILVKILEKSVGPDGCTIESSRWSGFDYTELDQNGQLLYGVWQYACWTGDVALVKKYWKQIRLAGDFPLKSVFLDPKAGMLRNKREFWERNDSHGLEDGFELTYQFWVALGLSVCSELAAWVGDRNTADRWFKAAASLRDHMLSDPVFRLIEEGHLIKRRTRDGRWQRYMIPPNRAAMPPGSPAATVARPACDPDTSNVYPIMFEMIDPARGTLAEHPRGRGVALEPALGLRRVLPVQHGQRTRSAGPLALRIALPGPRLCRGGRFRKGLARPPVAPHDPRREVRRVVRTLWTEHHPSRAAGLHRGVDLCGDHRSGRPPSAGLPAGGS